MITVQLPLYNEIFVAERLLDAVAALVSAHPDDGALLGGLPYEHRALLAQLVDRSDYGKVKEPVKGLQRGKLGEHAKAVVTVRGLGYRYCDLPRLR